MTSDEKTKPILIGPGNALEATGAPWHYWRRHAKALGVKIIAAGSKRFIIAETLVDALERRSQRPVLVPEPTEQDELAAMHKRIARAG